MSISTNNKLACLPVISLSAASAMDECTFGIKRSGCCVQIIIASKTGNIKRK